MELIDKRRECSETTLFKDVLYHSGQVFLYRGVCFLKLPPKDITQTPYNAINLESGSMCVICCDEKVTLVETELHILGDIK